ncbi:hypothetical protein EZV62_022494 [Acer yangbiense]|uniref:CCHC-type domain-containing protein n=1 Tax=Acer yangbiense TaxID=1000413 RepID=A0A5C7HA14_9ROSI|nr:hypothetical protein EZV62_022494 [Acer yangbiense]
MTPDDVAMLCASMTLKEIEGPVRSLRDELKDDGVRKLSLSLVGKVLVNRLINHEAFKRVLQKIWRVREGITIETIHNVPLLCMTKRIGQFLGSMIGVVEEIDEGVSGDCDGKFLRESVMLLQYECLPDHCIWCGKLGHMTVECLPIVRQTYRGMQTNQQLKVVESNTGASSMEIMVATQVKLVGKHSEGLHEVGKLPDSDGIPMETNLEGVGVGKGNSEIIMHVDSSEGDDDKSRENREAVKAQDRGPIEDLGCGASSVNINGANKPANYKGNVSKTSSPSIKYGPNLLDVNCGASHLKSLKEEDDSQKAHSVGRWRRFRHDEDVVSNSLGKGNSAGKRTSSDQESNQQGASKKAKENLFFVGGKGLH